MTVFTPADRLHRLVKQALDSGAATTLAQAQALFAGYRLGIVIGDAAAHDPHHQATLLTSVALARRVFLGGVCVHGATAAPLLTPMPLGATMADAITTLGGTIGELAADTPLITIGGEPSLRRSGFHIRTLLAGWRGGIAPAHSDAAISPAPVMPLAPMLAAGLAVNEAFLFVSRQSSFAGRRVAGLSLWNPSAACDWLSHAGDEPELRLLPSRLWLIGLGHLGQAYLWALGLLPYVNPADLHLILQDTDVITPSTESTSVLTDGQAAGTMKTRAMAAWCERRGFTARLHERLFDASFRRQPDEPAVALCGLDNAMGRRALDQVGFDFVVEAGLGRGHRDFRAIRLHTLPASRPAAQIWPAVAADDVPIDRPAYAGMLERGELDRCGVTLLAGKAVGAPFVGAVAATLAIAELLRLLQGGPVHELIDLDLKAPEYRVSVPTRRDFSTLNPGFVIARDQVSA